MRYAAEANGLWRSSFEIVLPSSKSMYDGQISGHISPAAISMGASPTTIYVGGRTFLTFAEKCRLTTVPFTVSLGQVARRGPAGYRVLVVDDLLISWFSQTLPKVINIATVQSGSQALEASVSNDTHENGHHNLVKTDIQMPGMRGMLMNCGDETDH